MAIKDHGSTCSTPDSEKTCHKWVFRFLDNKLTIKSDTSDESPGVGDHNIGDNSEPFNGLERTEKLLPDLNPEPRTFLGKPLSAAAVVQHTQSLDSYQSWTIETKTPRGKINALRLNHDRSLAAIGGDDGTVRIFDTDNWNLESMSIGHIAVTAIRWVTREMLLVASEDGIVRLWKVDKQSSQVLRTWHNDGIPVCHAMGNRWHQPITDEFAQTRCDLGYHERLHMGNGLEPKPSACIRQQR